jgi:glycosyltransferase involved in cell wall biosynthesis
MPNLSEPQPKKLTYVTGGINSKLGYVKTVLLTAKQKHQFDLIVCGHINLIPLAMMLRVWLNAPVLLCIYGIDAWQPTKSRLTNMMVRRVDAFVSISEITRQRFMAWSKLSEEKGFLLPNAIHLEDYGPGPKNLELLKSYGFEGKTVLMTLGRLVSHDRYKGFDEVLETLPELAREIPGIAYLIVGKGGDQCRLEEKASALGIAERVVFTGFIREAEKAEHYRLADVYVMPSRGEGFGFVLLEAMACGIPVIASGSDGTREAVCNGKLGLLVDPDNPKQLIKAILQALKMPREIPKGLEYFSFDHFAKRLHSILDQVGRLQS